MKLIYFLFFLLVFSFTTRAQQFLTKIYGLNAYVHLPPGYDNNNQTYPAIIFFPGVGELGTNASKLLAYGPSKFIAEGHNMEFMVNGVRETPIVISIQPIDAFPQPPYLDAIFNAVMAGYRIDPNRFHVTGLSMGGFCADNYVTQSAAFANRITSIVAMSAVIPNNPIDNFKWYAQAGGKWWGFEGLYDYRFMDKIRDVMNATVPGSALYTMYVGGHSGWNTWYDPSWRENGLSIYEWMLMQRKGNAPAPPPPAPAPAPAPTPPAPTPPAPTPPAPTPPTPGPLKYKYYTFGGTWYNLPVIQALNPTATGTVNDITLANRTQDDHFAYLWEGYINIPVSGDYTFRTTSDDGSQFWLGSYPGPIVYNDGLHGPQDREGTVTLNAGVYPIAVLYYEQDGGETMVLSWKTPQTGGAYVQVPPSAYVDAQVAAAPPVETTGLNYKYYTYKGVWPALPDFNALTPVSTGRVANVLITPRTQNDNFAFLWEGYINIPTTGTYTFRTNSDDGSKLYIGTYNYSANALVNNDGLHAGQDRDGTITLNAGTYPIAITFYEQDSREYIDVYWKTPSSNTFVPIPDNAFKNSASSLNALSMRVSEYNAERSTSGSAPAAAGETSETAIGRSIPEVVKPNLLAVFPNPVENRVNLQLSHTENGAVQVSIINAQGVILQNKRYQKESINWLQQLDVSNLKPGYYILQVKGKTINYKQSFIKK